MQSTATRADAVHLPPSVADGFCWVVVALAAIMNPSTSDCSRSARVQFLQGRTRAPGLGRMLLLIVLARGTEQLLLSREARQRGPPPVNALATLQLGGGERSSMVAMHEVRANELTAMVDVALRALGDEDYAARKGAGQLLATIAPLQWTQRLPELSALGKGIQGHKTCYCVSNAPSQQQPTQTQAWTQHSMTTAITSISAPGPAASDHAGQHLQCWRTRQGKQAHRNGQ
jgi:hypothetical protein